MKQSVFGIVCGVIVGLIVLAFMGLSIYAGATGKSYKEIFTTDSEKETVVEDDKTPDTTVEPEQTELTICA